MGAKSRCMIMLETPFLMSQDAHNLPRCSQYCTMTTHGMRNETHIRLKWLRRLVQRSGLFLTRDQKYLCLTEEGEPGRMLSSQITDELELVAHPVGLSFQRKKISW